MDNRKQSQTIKAAFILSIIAGTFFDVFSLIYLLFGTYLSSYDLITNSYFIAMFYLAIMTAPMVMGIIALNMVGKIKNIKGSQRVFVILTRVFSIVSIVGTAVIITVIFLLSWLVMALLS